MLLDSIKNDLKLAMKAKDSLKISTLRMITSSIKNIEINKRSSSNEDLHSVNLNDSEILQLLSKMIKQRKESAEIYNKSNRSDLEKKENDEIKIISEYMPSQMDDKKMESLIDEVIANTESRSIKDMGKIMSFLKEKYSGQIDFGKASAIIKNKLNLSLIHI